MKDKTRYQKAMILDAILVIFLTAAIILYDISAARTGNKIFWTVFGIINIIKAIYGANRYYKKLKDLDET